LAKNLLLLCLAAGLLGSSAILLWLSTFSIPNLESIENRRVTESTKIYDRTGKILLYDVHEDVKRKTVPMDEISRYVKNATVAIEDAEFYQHHGIRPISILRAVIANLSNQSYSQGGSTITQQVVKNSLLTQEKRISRKIKEWVLSLKLEGKYSKEQILALYLNESPYGGSIYGIEEASQSFLGVSSKDVTLAQAAYLAALPNAPSYYSPYGQHRDKLEERKNLVLYRMMENGFITQAEYETAKKEKVTFRPQEEKGIKAPHFVFYIKQYLEEKYGHQFVEEHGLKVTTTLNYELQEKAEAAAKKYALENKKTFDAENASMVGIDPQTGEILVMVGSRDYFDDTIDGNFNIALAKRQPGSAFKPFVYATAFGKGYLPQTVLFDVKTEFSTECNPDGTQKYPTASCYMPENYDHIYRGPISLRDALAQSINIPAIETLYLAGMKDSLQTAKDMGITTLTNTDRYGLTLVLGGGEVTLLDITSAYGGFANGGNRIEHTGILKVEDKDGTVIEELKPQPNRVLDENVAKMINDVLSDNKARTPAFGAQSPLYFPGRDVAVKTGTTNDYRDAWIIGYTPNFVLGAWAGNNDNHVMEKKVARFIVAPMWNEVMNIALKDLPNKKFERVPDVTDRTINPVVRGFWQGGQSYVIDKISGKLATETTPEETKEERVVRNIHSILYWVNKSNPQGPPPNDPTQDPQFASWEYAIREWARNQNLTDETSLVVPTSFDNVHSVTAAPRISIQSPSPDRVFQPTETMRVAVTITGEKPALRMDTFINGSYITSTRSYPFTTDISLSSIESLQSDNVLKVVVYDSIFNRSEVSIPFKVAH
jgi:1A family penicillin-binding protein